MDRNHRIFVDVHHGLEFDALKPDGTTMRLFDVSRVTALGWAPKIQLRDGIDVPPLLSSGAV